MFKFEQKHQLFLDQKKLSFRHTHFLDLSEFRRFSKGFTGEIFHLGNEKFECYISQVLSDNIKLGLYQHNSPILYKGYCLNHFTFSLSAVHQGDLYCHQYKIEKNMITVVYPHQEIAALRQKFQGNYILVFQDEFLDHLCETLELSELKKRLDTQRIPSVIKVDSQKINYIRHLCHQIYQLLFKITAPPDSSPVNPLLINHSLKQTLEEEVAKTLIIALAEATDIKLKKTQIKRSHILKKAEDFYLGNLTSDITTKDVCQELKVSQRSLEYIFKDYYQISPQNYFKHLRMNALHQALQQADDTADLRQITEAFGFYHRGQLAKDYRQLFGQFPSQVFKNNK